MQRRSCFLWILLCVLAFTLLAVYLFVPALAAQTYGPAGPSLNAWQRFVYSASLLWNSADLTVPVNVQGDEQLFTIEQGETVLSISLRLVEAGLIPNAQTFRDYLVYAGVDTSIQTGTYRLSPAMNPVEIASIIQDSLLSELSFSVLPGWRMEEIAASLPTSGLDITPAMFLSAVRSPLAASDLLPYGASAEGLLFPDVYMLPRNIPADQLVSLMMLNFTQHLTSEMAEGYSRQGLDVYQAVILASIVQREAVVEDEQSLIVSVFLNRLAVGMRLESDPTVQYALGYNQNQGTWWTNPLSLENLWVDSPFNTYVYYDLPPAPICNPSLGAMQAVANSSQSPYYYFRALCDGSGRHAFAETFEQHKQNACP